MKTLHIEANPELSEKYPAIDGIAKPMRIVSGVRLDVLKILEMEDAEFNDWFSERYEATERLLGDYKLSGSVPDLRYGEDSYTLGEANSCMRNMIKTLEDGLAYLNIMKQIREESIIQ